MEVSLIPKNIRRSIPQHSLDLQNSCYILYILTQMKPRYNTHDESLVWELVVSSLLHGTCSPNKAILGGQWLSTAMLEPGESGVLVVIHVGKGDVSQELTEVYILKAAKILCSYKKTENTQ